jgi:hypothetical protein
MLMPMLCGNQNAKEDRWCWEGWIQNCAVGRLLLALIWCFVFALRLLYCSSLEATPS